MYQSAATIGSSVFGGFGTWAVVAPLSSAANAPGIIAVESYRKTVQHLEGGIVKTIHEDRKVAAIAAGHCTGETVCNTERHIEGTAQGRGCARPELQIESALGNGSTFRVIFPPRQS